MLVLDSVVQVLPHLPLPAQQEKALQELEHLQEREDVLL